MTKTKISWTQETWNPVTGCDAVSAGCDNCYARSMAKRLKAMGVHKYRNEFKVTMHPDTLTLPHQWERPRIVFVNSMSDLFHDEVTDDFRKQIFAVMKVVDRHIYQVLTKRSKAMVKAMKSLPSPPNVWMGVTVEDSYYKYRIDHLKQVPAAVRFLSIEPLIGPIGKLDLTDIHLVIIGAESGPKRRPCKIEWVYDIVDQCKSAGVPVHIKQLEIDGKLVKDINDPRWPKDLKIREMV